MGRSQGIVQLILTLIVLGVIIMATVIGNIFVIAAILLERNLRTVANSLIASLAVADLMVAALVMPLAAVNDINDRWVLGREVCEMWTSFDVLCCTSSILHLVVISLDRYWAVTRVDYIHNRSPRRIGLMIGASWGLSVVISIPPLFGWRGQDTVEAESANRTEQCVISQDPAYTVFSTVGAFYLPLAFIVVVYLNVYRVASARIRRRNFPPGPGLVTTTTTTTQPPPVEETPSGLNLAPEETSAAAPQGFPDEISLAVLPGCSSRTSSIQDDSIPGGNEKIADLIAASRQFLSVTPRSCSASSSPASTPRGSWLSLTPSYFRGVSVKGTEKRIREKRRAQGRERKAARTLVVITGSFVVCWLPFFLLATVRPFCGDRCPAPAVVVSAISWLGYFNSVLNPIIYTVFNPDFRTAFRKIIFGKYRRRRSPRTIPVPVPEKESRA